MASTNKPKHLFADMVSRVCAATTPLVGANANLTRVVVEPSRDPTHGDMATNAAMVLATDAGKKPRELQDVYGMSHGHVPKPHTVPKFEDLLTALHPDILVVQTGSNLFGLFPDAKTVRPAQNAAALRTYFLPFKEKAITPPSTLRKIYWLSPPTSGRGYRISRRKMRVVADEPHRFFRQSPGPGQL